ncbi:MAG TPA: nitrogen fixation protein NifQ [Cellvibrionaceae bacterium]|nr:nitrogen fixation protein NifQ [Cellvibrionaceae bacterium]HMW72962.1 nitrogen fixation protein NifQ [Cellvibrionaceae bacterium]
MSPPVVSALVHSEDLVNQHLVSQVDINSANKILNGGVAPAQWFDKLLGQQRQGRGCLPYFLGLQQADFERILQRVSGQLGPGVMANSLSTGEIFERALLRQELLELRRDEWLELRNLVNAFAANTEVLQLQLAEIIAAGCLGGDHLWRDLGFTQRSELSEFMLQNFPALAALNTNDMKWKKFFYKQLCELGGGYVCRSPSCEACTAYSDCFGSED